MAQVLLAKSMAKMIKYGIDASHAPQELGGFLVVRPLGRNERDRGGDYTRENESRKFDQTTKAAQR